MAGPARVSFASSAVVDLEELRTYYDEQQVPGVGARMLGEMFGRIEALKSHPDLGRVVPEFGQENLREIIHPPLPHRLSAGQGKGEDRARLAERAVVEIAVKKRLRKKKHRLES